jgi:SPP1 gp7 family putative phage head morphogenesis protein
VPHGPAGALAALPAHAVPRLSADEEAYLRKFYDDDSSRRFSYDHFQKTHGQLLEAVNEGWPAKDLKPEYSSPDHLTRACFEADVHRFGYTKTQYQVLQLNQLVKDSKDFAGFKAEASKLLTNLNVRNLKAEFDTAKATSVMTANALRAIAEGAGYMRYKATQDDKTRPYHASLHNRVFDMSKPGWENFVPPLGWNCRCHVVFEDDRPKVVTTPDEAEQLLTPDEVARLKKDGFLLNRIDQKKLFSQKQNYLNGLQDPEQVAYQMGRLQYVDQGQQPWANINKSAMSPVNTPTGLKAADAKKDFDAAAVNDVREYTDYAGRPLFLRKADLDGHLLDKYTRASQNRQGIYFQIEEVVSDPDEVYFSEFRKKNGDTDLSYTYLKFYNDGVLLTAVEFSEAQPQIIKSWYNVDAPDTRRNGLLIHRKK